jgi:hypothetical protein
MSELAPTRASEPAAEPLGFGPAVLAVFACGAIGGAIVAFIWSVLPLYARPYGHAGWTTYALSYTVAESIAAAFFVPLAMRMFRYRISYAAALTALLAGDVAAYVISRAFVTGSSPSSTVPIDWTMPFSSMFGFIGGIAGLLLSAWIVVHAATRPLRN